MHAHYQKNRDSSEKIEFDAAREEPGGVLKDYGRLFGFSVRERGSAGLSIKAHLCGSLSSKPRTTPYYRADGL